MALKSLCLQYPFFVPTFEGIVVPTMQFYCAYLELHLLCAYHALLLCLHGLWWFCAYHQELIKIITVLIDTRLINYLNVSLS